MIEVRASLQSESQLRTHKDIYVFSRLYEKIKKNSTNYITKRKIAMRRVKRSISH